MATIRSVFSPGATFNVLDPNAWVGGVVPGPNDIAQIGENGDYRTQINMSTPYNSYLPPTKNGGAIILPWDESDTTIRVYANNTNYNSEYIFPDTSGSFLVYVQGSYPLMEFPVKINYTNKSLSDAYYFYSCSVDTSYGTNWVFRTGSELYKANITPEGYYSESFGYIQHGNYVYPLETKFELTGSQEWHVGQIETLERCHLTIKDSAHLKLDGTTVNPNAIYNNSDSYRNVIRILDNSTIEFTGSVQRSVAGFYYYNRDSYNRIQLSGSDNCVNTTLSQSVNKGNHTLLLTNSTGFGKGDIISIDHSEYDVYYKRNSPSLDYTSENNAYYIPYGLDLFYSSGSKLQGGLGQGHSYIDHNFDDIEVVQIVSKSGDEITIAQLWGKEGIVHEDLGLYNYEQFVQTFGGTPSRFEGNKRAILVDCDHKSFKKGEKLIISESLVTEILYEDYYLSSSTLYDFTDDATIEGTFHMPQYRLTGSFLAPTESLYNNSSLQPYYYQEYYDVNNNIMVSERTHSLSGEVTRSAHLRSSDTYIYSLNNAQTRWSAFITNSFDFHEGEVEMEYNFYKYRYDDELTQTYNNYDTQARIYLQMGCSPHSGIGLLPYTILGSSLNQYYYFGRYQDNLFFDGSTVKSFALRGLPEFTSSFRWPASEGQNEKIKITHKNGVVDAYYNDVHVHQLNRHLNRGPIGIIGWRYVNIYNIKISKYYQLVLLNTDQSVNSKDQILEGAKLDYNHTQGQRIRTNANKIKDALGHKNIFHAYKDDANTNILPYLHGQTTQQNTNGNYYNYYRHLSDSDGGAPTGQYISFYGSNPSYRKTGTDFYIVYDIQTPVSMSAVSLQWYYSYNHDYMEMAGENIQVDVSNDINAANPWTTVYGPSPDSKLTSRMGQHRFFHFPSGSISAQFIKITLNGNSRETSNVISKLGIHNFYNSEGNDLGNSIELYNADNFAVGDKVYFVNYKNPNPRITFQNDDSDGITNLDREKIVPNILGGNLTHDDIHGGTSIIYDIIAKNGNRITLDRTMASYPIDKDTIVYKWNQGGINFTGDYSNIYRFLIYNNDDYSNPYQVRGVNFNNLYYPQVSLTNRNKTYNSEFRECSINQVKSSVVYLGDHIASNNIIIGGQGAYLAYINEDTQKYDYRDLVTYNNHISSNNSSLYFFSNVNNNVNKAISLYNSVYRIRENTFYDIISYAQRPWEKLKTPILKFKHNFSTGHSYALGERALAYTLSYNTNESIDKTEYKDNYQGYGYFSRSVVNNNFNQFQDRNLSDALFNPNIEYSWKPYLFYLKYNNYPARAHGWLGSIFDRQDHHITPFRIFDPIHNSNIVVWGTAEQSYASLRSFSHNRYTLSNNGYYTPHISQFNRYQGIFNNYRCQFNIKETQNIQIQLSFNYKLTGTLPFYHTNRNNGTQFNAYFMEDYWLPKVMLVDENTTVIHSDTLDFTLDNQDYSYNQTFTLTPGTYNFILNKKYDQNFNERNSNFMEHGPIDLQMFSDSPNKFLAISNTWDAYQILEGENRYVRDKINRSGNSVTNLIRPSNSVPRSKIKLRKVKL